MGKVEHLFHNYFIQQIRGLAGGITANNGDFMAKGGRNR